VAQAAGGGGRMIAPGDDVLARVPGAADGPFEVAALRGGLTNRSFLVGTALGRFVVRLGTGADALLGIDRHTEAAAQRLAATVAVAPRVIDADESSGLLITEYVAGRAWGQSDFATPGQIDRLGSQLARLHALDAHASANLPARDPLAAAHGYVARIVQEAPGERAALTRLLGQAADAHLASGAGARPATLVHSDLHGSNIVDGEGLWLIDWEYAALADPLQDVASVLAYHPDAAAHAGRLLDAVGLGDVTRRDLLAAVWMFQLLVFLWYRVRRLAVAPTSADLAAERRAHAALVHNGNL